TFGIETSSRGTTRFGLIIRSNGPTLRLVRGGSRPSTHRTHAAETGGWRVPMAKPHSPGRLEELLASGPSPSNDHHPLHHLWQRGNGSWCVALTVYDLMMTSRRRQLRWRCRCLGPVEYERREYDTRD